MGKLSNNESGYIPDEFKSQELIGAKNINYKKTVIYVAVAAITLIVIATLIPLFFNRNKDAATILESKLQEEYGQEFVVESMGGSDPYNRDFTQKASVYPKNDPSLKFDAEISDNMRDIKDNYIGNYLVQKTRLNIEDMLKKRLKLDLTVKAWLDKDGTFQDDKGNINYSLKEYFENNKQNRPVYFIAINAVPIEAERVKISEEVVKLINGQTGRNEKEFISFTTRYYSQMMAKNNISELWLLAQNTPETAYIYLDGAFVKNIQ